MNDMLDRRSAQLPQLKDASSISRALARPGRQVQAPRTARLMNPYEKGKAPGPRHLAGPHAGTPSRSQRAVAHPRRTLRDNVARQIDLIGGAPFDEHERPIATHIGGSRTCWLPVLLTRCGHLDRPGRWPAPEQLDAGGRIRRGMPGPAIGSRLRGRCGSGRQSYRLLIAATAVLT